jgi:uncharacterized protein YecE (DUF72 family)
MSRILYGTAGWSYPDWKGVVYPASPGRDFDELAFLASHFDTVEINNTFYRPPAPRTCESWVRRTEARPEFLFTAKLHRSFTHEKNPAWSGAEAAAFRDGLAPLVEAGKLGALLLQFPWSFRNTQENRKQLSRLASAFEDLPRVAEVRHASWQIDAAFRFLEALGMGFCNLDQPDARDSIGPTAVATSAVGYVRFHGRNRKAWFDREAGRDERYNYLYSEEELLAWVPRIRAVAKRAERTFVVGNNHFKGQAPANVLQIRTLLEGGEVRAPAPLLDAFPFLQTGPETGTENGGSA